MRELLRHGSHWMLPDDHDVTNALSEDTWMDDRVFVEAAKRAFYEYQWQLAEDIPPRDPESHRVPLAEVRHHGGHVQACCALVWCRACCAPLCLCACVFVWTGPLVVAAPPRDVEGSQRCGGSHVCVRTLNNPGEGIDGPCAHFCHPTWHRHGARGPSLATHVQPEPSFAVHGHSASAATC